jgi:hypothetical protein
VRLPPAGFAVVVRETREGALEQPRSLPWSAPWLRPSFARVPLLYRASYRSPQFTELADERSRCALTRASASLTRCFFDLVNVDILYLRNRV